MVEIPDSLQHKDNEAIYSKESWKHGVDCSTCKTSIVGERFFCTVLFGRYVVRLTPDQAPPATRTSARSATSAASTTPLTRSSSISVPPRCLYECDRSECV